MTDPEPGSRLRDHPHAYRLAVANVIDGLGTYVGLAALIVVGYHSTRLLGTAMVLAAHVLPGLLVSMFVAPRLQHRQRRSTLLALNFAGVLALVPAVAAPNAGTAILAAAMLGAVGVATRGVQMAALAEAVPSDVRGRFYGMVGSFGQAVQVVGLASGGALAAALSSRAALAIDALSFLCAAIVIATIRFAVVPPPDHAARSRMSFGAAPRLVWSIPLLRMLACVTWIGALVATVPEAASPGVTSTRLLPLVMAASPAGGAVAALLCTRFGVFGRVVDTLRLALVSGVSLVVLGGGMYLALQQPASSPGRAVYGIVANVVIGGLGIWFLGMMAAFAEYTPESQTVAIGSFMSWSVGAASGLGGFAVALLGVSGGYAALGVVLIPAVAWGLRLVRPTAIRPNPPIQPVPSTDAGRVDSGRG